MNAYRAVFLCSRVRWGWLIAAAAALAAGPPDDASARDDLPENLARAAKASANSEYSDKYLAHNAVDGKIPPADSHADLGTAWCVRKAESGDCGEFVLTWPEPVDLATIVYFGRTAWYMSECWKDYEVYLNDAAEPIAKGTFKQTHGPQSIEIPKTKAARLRLKFLNSYGGPNPGASEVMVFDRPVSDEQLGWAAPAPNEQALAQMPWADQVDPAALRELIIDLGRRHGEDYARYDEHLAQLDELQGRLATFNRSSDAATAADVSPAQGESAAEPIGAELRQLQRSVLLFDVERVVAICRHEINASHVYTYHYEGFKPGGGLYVIDAHDPEADPHLLVESPEGQILDCDLSYDGRTVLFSWRRSRDEGYHLWKVDVDGTDLEQLTDGVWHDYNACWLPDGGIAFLSSRSPQFAYCWHAPVGVVHRMDADGSNVRKLSANYLNDFTPYVLDDGRIIYSRWEYVDRPAIPIQSLWTVNPDGTCLSGFFGNRVLSPGTFMEARSIPGTAKIVCTMTGHNGPTRGAIGVIDRSKGVNAQAAIENITPDVPVQPVDQGNGNTRGTKQYSCPTPLDGRRLLVSIRGPVLARTFDGRCQSLALPAPADGQMQYFCTQPIRPRPRPPVIPSSLSSSPESEATLFLQDVYNGLEPMVERGEVKAIRVVREMQKTVRIDPSQRAFGFQFPVISCGATYAGKMVLGEVPVEPDGSACFKVPAGVPLYFMALDPQGRAVQRMRTFTHLMPGEVQGCIGCHEHRRRASPPQMSMAMIREPRRLQPPEWGVGGFDYARIVQPVLDRHCVKCHDAVDPPRGIDLTAGKTDFFNVSYDVLARENQGRAGSPYVSWIPTYNGHEQNILKFEPKAWGSPQSLLAEVVLSGHPNADGKPRVQLEEYERRRILAWIDLNVPYYGSSETAYPELRGCRQLAPEKLEKVLAEVAARRCADCHDGGKIPRRDWVRITEPEFNPFLLAPLAREAGGTERCGKAVFADRNDPDYQAILATFEPIAQMISRRPRMDMEGGQPAADVCRSCQ